MTVTKKFDEYIFTAASIFGCLSNDQLKKSINEDINALMDMDLSWDSVVVERYTERLGLVIRQMVRMEAHRSMLDLWPKPQEFKGVLEEGKKEVLALARKGVKLLLELQKHNDRPIYKKQLALLQFVFLRHDQYK